MSETVEAVFEQQRSLLDRARDAANDLLNSRLGRIAAAGVAAVGLMGALNSETSAEAQSAVPSVTLVCPDGTKDGPGRYGYAFIIENLTGTQSEGTNSIPSQASTKWVSAPGAKSIFPLDGSQENVELVVTQEKPFQQELKRETFRCSPNTTTTSTATTAPPRTVNPNAASGYVVVSSNGAVDNFGNAIHFGSKVGEPLNHPIVGAATRPNGDGYWEVASDGGVFSFGAAKFHGSTGAIKLNKPVVGMASTPSGEGYYLVASDGGIFAFGDAKFKGSTGAMQLNKSIVGMSTTPSGEGYRLVASDGGIFAFGDAEFKGSTGAIKLNQPVVGMDSNKNGDGYVLVASDGGVFAFGNTAFHGSTGNIKLNQPIRGISLTDAGYRFVAADGGVFAFGDAAFYGSATGPVANKVAIKSTPSKTQ